MFNIFMKSFDGNIYLHFTLSHSEFGSLLFTLIILTFRLYVYVILLYKVEKDVFRQYNISFINTLCVMHVMCVCRLLSS